MDNEGRSATPGPAEANSESMPLLPGHAAGSEDQAVVPGRALVIEHWINIVTGPVMLGLLLAVGIGLLAFRPDRYSAPWPFVDMIPGMIILALIAISWSVVNLVSLRRSRTLLPLGISAIVHVCVGVYDTVASARGLLGMLNNWSYCNEWINPSEDPLTGGVERCREWAAKFDILLWALWISVLVVTMVQIFSFIVTCVTIYRGRSTWRSVDKTLRLSAGQFTLEFSTKFLGPDTTTNTARSSDEIA